MKSQHLHIKSAAVLALLGFSSAFGQTATSPAASPGTKDEVVELSPFVVNAEEDTGYQATNTLAGSRMNTSLKDTAASISVLTEEFMKDIGAINLNDAIAFGNNVEFDDTQTSNDNATFEFFSTFRIRGQAATVARNYFRWKLPADLFNAERIEEARGPNSILFGIASAGGLISTQTKQASTNRNFRRGQLVYGSYDSRRATVDINQTAFNGKFGVRFNAVTSKSNGYQHFVFNEDNRAHLALKYNLTPNTIIRAEYERGKTHSNKANNQEIGDNLMRWYNAGRPLVGITGTATGVARNNTAANLSVNLVEESPGVIGNFDARGQGISQSAGSNLITDPTIVDTYSFQVSIGGAGQTQSSEFDAYSAFIEHKLGKKTYLQLAYNHQNYDFSSWQSRLNSGLKGDPNQFLRDGVTPNPHAGQMYFENWWVDYIRHEKLDNLRFSVSTELDFGKWGEYRLAALAEREESNFLKNSVAETWLDEGTGRGAFNSLVTAGVNRVLRRHYITQGAYGTYFASFDNPGNTGFISGMTDPSNPTRKLKTQGTSGISDFDDPQEQDSYLAALQAYYLKRKLILAGGYRADTLYLHEGKRGVLDPQGVPIIDNVNNPRTNRTLDAKTRTYGAVYHVLPWLSLRYNNSNSNELANTTVRLMPNPDAEGRYKDSKVGDNPQGQGEDYGIDLNLFDGKIFVRATKFSTTRAGAQGFTYGGTVDNPSVMSNRVLTALVGNGLITQTEADARTLSTGGSTFDVASEGYEFSVIANPTRNWRISANYSITDSATSNVAPEIQKWASTEIPYFQKFNQNLLVSTGDTIAAEIARWQNSNAINLSVAGVSTIGNRRDKVSLVNRYSFTEGKFKGLFVGATVRHQGRVVVAATTAGKSLYGNSFTRVDAFCGYNFGRLPHLEFLKNLSVQLNVYNVLNQHDPLVNRFANPNAAVLEVNRLVPQEPLYWRLTANLAF